MATIAQPAIRTAPSSPRTNVVRFELNQPQEVSLYDMGIVVSGRYGEQKKYQLLDGRVMYLDLEAARIIDSSPDIKAGDTLVITKRQAVDGSRRIAWFVERSRAQRIPPQPAAQLIERAVALDGTYNADPAGHPPTRLESALRAAVKATFEAEQYADSLGFALRFSPSDIRALAVSQFISLSQRGGGIE